MPRLKFCRSKRIVLSFFVTTATITNTVPLTNKCLIYTMLLVFATAKVYNSLSKAIYTEKKIAL